ncbi:MAG: hypothetical protein ACRC2T_01770 [Thermoguttaceae bacterium]
MMVQKRASDGAMWLIFTERYPSNPTHSRREIHQSQISDGMLKLIAILVQLASDSQVLVFDDIDYGISPQHFGFLVNELFRSEKQLFVSVKNNAFLDHIDKASLCNSVHGLYRKPSGSTKQVPLFDVSAIKKKAKTKTASSILDSTDMLELIAQAKNEG